jgi:PEP-CTERM motif
LIGFIGHRDANLEKYMKAIARIGSLVVLTLLAADPARALVILDVSGGAVALSDPTQNGRLSRNGLGQDWALGEPFPGVINTLTAYHYLTYVVNVGNAPYVQVILDSSSTNIFISAYDTFYAPNSAGGPNFGFDTNWLGDAGLSGNDFGVDPLFFQVFVPLNHNLVLVINNTGASNVGVGDRFNLLVEGFADTEFNDPVPEPATMVLTGSGLALMALRRRRASR